MAGQEDIKRTLAYGEAAMSYIRQNTQPAFPRNYELWYTYAAGFNVSLNRAVNDVITTKGHISTDDLQKIYAKFLSPNHLGDRVDEVSAQVADEVQDLVDAIQLSADATSDYGQILQKASESLKGQTDSDKLKTLVSHMIKSTHAAVAANQNLENQLLESKRQIKTLQENLESIRYESLTDDLTTLSNRKHFDMMIEKAVAGADETGDQCALLMTDIDHFKRFNDTYGHQTGDQVLRLVALAVKQNVKGNDSACRYGGEEFAVILPHTQLETALEVAENIRKTVISKELVKRSTGENLGRITISIGVSLFRPGDTSQTMIARADEALYEAKRGGRNMVKLENTSGMQASQVA